MPNLPVEAACLPPVALALIDAHQQRLPLVSRPFALLGQRHGLTETQTLDLLGQALSEGVLSRVGAVFAPNTVGASTLAALAVPPDQLEGVAAYVSSLPQVNHNYARDHAFNLWFVVAADTPLAVRDVLARIHLSTGLKPLNLPLECEYHIDLGFSFLDDPDTSRRSQPQSPAAVALTEGQRRLVSALGEGLALVPRPFAVLGETCGLGEGEVLDTLARWLATGVVRRLGCIVRHRELGFRANAMCVWQIPADALDHFGQRLAADPAVNLCYARPARPPDWPYTLFAMVHGRDPAHLHATVETVRQRCGLTGIPHAVLLSTHRYTQRGARYHWSPA